MMPTISVDRDTHERLRLVAAALGVDEAEAVRELLRRLGSGSGAPTSAADLATDGKVPIHVVYKGHRIEAEFDAATHGVVIASGSLSGKKFNSPSRAAIEVVRTINPNVHPNRNGWGFWLVTSTGKELQSIR